MEYKFLDQYLQDDTTNDKSFLEGLNAEQKDAVLTTEGAVLIIAGAGSGKTTTLIKRTANILSKGIDGSQILLLTFTNKAAKEMKERGEIALDKRFKNVKACTYHSFCFNVLRKYISVLGMDNEFLLKDPGDIATLLKMITEILGFDKLEKFPDGSAISAIFSKSVNIGDSLENVLTYNFPKYTGYCTQLRAIKEEYTNYKREKSILDYDDLMIYTIKILSEHNDIRRKVADQYKYIMVDEYQDSNALQLNLLKLLRTEDNPNICVVGDDQQCIYGFRGSVFENIINFPHQFSPCKVIILNKNYRSNQEILDLSNAVIENAEDKYDKQLVGFRAKGEKPCIVKVQNNMEEAKWIINKVLEYAESGTPLNDIAILSRNSKDTDSIETLIVQIKNSINIPYKKYGGLKFFDRAYVKDILAYLKVVADPKDEISWYRILQLYPGIGTTYAKRIYSDINENGLECLISKKYYKRKYAEYLVKIYKCMNELPKLSLSGMIDSVINKHYSFARTITVDNMNSPDSVKKAEYELIKSNLEDAQILIKMSENYKSLNLFLSDMILETISTESKKDALTLSTVHSIKGLEYKVVFIMDCIDNHFCRENKPVNNSYEAKIRAKKINEEDRRILYVALTRAKDDLYIMWPREIVRYGQRETTNLNRFLKEKTTNGVIYKRYATFV